MKYFKLLLEATGFIVMWAIVLFIMVIPIIGAVVGLFLTSIVSDDLDVNGYGFIGLLVLLQIPHFLSYMFIKGLI